MHGIYLTKNKKFNWFLGGASHHINIATDFSASKVFINKENVIIASNNIEPPCLKDEEIEVNDLIKYKGHYWFKSLAEKTNKIAIDREDDSYECFQQELKRLRMQLTENELKRYRVLGQPTGNIIESVAKNLNPGLTENEIAANIAKKVMKKSMQ